MLCSFRLGRQEDAHEYLVSLLDAMHEAILESIHPKPPREVAQTSFIYRIFGGTCRSQVGRAHALVHWFEMPPFGLHWHFRADRHAWTLSGASDLPVDSDVLCHPLTPSACLPC